MPDPLSPATATPSPSEPVIICLCTSPTGRVTQITLGISDLRIQGHLVRQAANRLTGRHQTEYKRQQMLQLDAIANVLIDLADWADGKISDTMIGLP